MKALKRLAVLPFVFILASCGESRSQDYSYQQEPIYTQSEYDALMGRIECYKELLDDVSDAIDDVSYMLNSIHIDYNNDSVDEAGYDIDDANSKMTSIDNYWGCS
jgi:hypothetical protein